MLLLFKYAVKLNLYKCTSRFIVIFKLFTSFYIHEIHYSRLSITYLYIYTNS